MKKLPLLLTTILLGALSAGLRADTVTLKSGEKVEGTILSESDDQVEIETQVSASIKDTRQIPKTEIEKIDKMGPDDQAYEEIKRYKIDPQNSLPPEAYTRIIGVFQDFLLRFSESKHAADVRADMAKFQEERDHVANGEVKFAGRWLSKEEAERNKYELEAQQEFALMKQHVQRGDMPGVLNTFDLIEKNHAGARIYPDALELAQQILAALKQDIARRPALIAKEKAGMEQVIAMAPEPRKSQLKAKAAAAAQRSEALMAAAGKSGVRWKPYIPTYEKSVTAYKTAVDSELNRLASQPISAMRESIRLTDEAQAALERKDTATADKLLKEAKAKWAKNHAVEELTKQVGEVKALPKAATKASGTSGESGAKPSDAQVATGTAKDVKPFYMTLPGAAAIVGGVLVLIAIVNVAAKLMTKKKDEDRGQS